MVRAIGYIRVSTQEQANEGVSLEAQEKRIRSWCDAEGVSLIGVYSDPGLSGGRISNRPGLQRALSICRRGDLLIFLSLSRLSRSIKDILGIHTQLSRRGIDLVSLTEKLDTTGAMGKFGLHMLAVIAELERDVISERTRMAIQYLQRQRRYTGGQRPYGWAVGPMGELLPVPEEQLLIGRCLELRSDGMGFHRIAVALNKEGLKSSMGTKIHAEQIRRWIGSNRYQGEDEVSTEVSRRHA